MNIFRGSDINYPKTAFGIADKIVDLYVPMVILCAIVSIITTIIIYPEHWYFTLIITPFAGWAGPIVISSAVYLLEILVHSILHPTKSCRVIWSGILFVAFLGGSMGIALGTVRLCAILFATPDSSTWDFAYVSESPNAHRYHYSEQCNALRRTTYNIRTLTMDEVEDYDYEPCNLCLKESVRKKWDDAAGLVFIPVSCLIFGLINKIEQFSKKYKLRNPIVKR